MKQAMEKKVFQPRGLVPIRIAVVVVRLGWLVSVDTCMASVREVGGGNLGVKVRHGACVGEDKDAGGPLLLVMDR
jgi:hypothetical protein